MRIILALAVIVAGFAIGVAISGVVALLLWAIYSYAVAPSFSLPEISFLKFWLVMIFVSWIGRIMLGRAYSGAAK